MENKMIFSEKKVLSSAYIDSEAKLGVSQTILLIQDAFSQLYGQLKCDGVIFKKLGYYWVLMKNKIKFFEKPEWNSKIKISSFPVDCAGFRTHVNTEIKDFQGNTVALSNQEICLLDIEKKRPVKISQVPYPQEGFPEAVYLEPYEKFDVPDEEYSEVYTQVVRQQHIDMSHHVNNVEYVRLALNVFSVDFMEKHKFDTVEVHYNSEALEGQTLNILMAEKENSAFIRIAENGRNVFEMKVDFKS